MTLSSTIYDLRSTISRGFTLIELLIVIAIIGILPAIVSTNLVAARARARDARRKGDLQAISQSLRLYYADYQHFPSSNSGNIIGCGALATVCTWGGTAAFAIGTTTYMGHLPLDPSSTTTASVTYFYTSAGGDKFALVGALENASDGDIAASQARCANALNGYTIVPETDYVVCAE